MYSSDCIFYEMSKQTHLHVGVAARRGGGGYQTELNFSTELFKWSVQQVHVVYDKLLNALDAYTGLGVGLGVLCQSTSKKCDITSTEMACFHFALTKFSSYWT